MNKLTYVVVVNYNGRQFLKECLNSLLAQTAGCKIVLVDNGSSDQSSDLIRADYSQIDLIQLPKNTGFAGGVNVGLRHSLEAGADYIALFNNDARAEVDWLEKLLSVMEQDKKIGMVTGRLLHHDGKRFDSTGDFYTTWGLPFPRGRDQLAEGKFLEEGEVFGASGGASLYRSAMFEDVGLFDERFFAYFEDVDISFRARLRDWEVYYQPEAVAYHRIGATSSRMGGFTTFHSIKNLFFLYHKNMPGALFWKNYWRFWLTFILMCAAALKRGQIAAFVKGLLSIVINLPGVILDRIKIQKGRRVSVPYIKSILSKEKPPSIKKLSGIDA